MIFRQSLKGLVLRCQVYVKPSAATKVSQLGLRGLAAADCDAVRSSGVTGLRDGYGLVIQVPRCTRRVES